MSGQLDAAQLERLVAARSVVVVTHRAPDADGLGAQVGLVRALRAMGKEVTGINSDPVPRRLSFLDPDGELLRYKSDAAAPALLEAADLIVLVDLAEVDRTGDLEKPIRERLDRVLAIDHHLVEEGEVAGFLVPTCSSCGELVTLVVRALSAPIDATSATALYTAMSYDTGSFRWIRNQSDSLRIAADLIDLGADATAIQEHLYATRPRDHVTLMARAAEACQFAHDGRLAYVRLEPSMLKGLELDREVYRDVISHLLSIEGVLVAATFKVEGSGRTTVRLSLRSKEAVEVVDVARAYGGGGHAHACGAHAVKVRPDELVAEVVELVGALLP